MTKCDAEKTAHVQIYSRSELKSIEVDCDGKIVEDPSAINHTFSLPIIISMKPEQYLKTVENDIVLVFDYLTYDCPTNEQCECLSKYGTFCEFRSVTNFFARIHNLTKLFL